MAAVGFPGNFILLTGCCETGPDQVPFMIKANMPGVEIEEFPADWEKFGKAAGPVRNAQMADRGDCLFLIWDGRSRGSRNMKDNMLHRNKWVEERILR